MRLVENGDGPDTPRSSDHEARKPLSRAPSYIRLARGRAAVSFDNLVALANHQEHLKEARKIVWRDRGEPAVELASVWECIEHGGRGGLREYRSRPILVLTHFSQELAPSPLLFELASISC